MYSPGTGDTFMTPQNNYGSGGLRSPRSPSAGGRSPASGASSGLGAKSPRPKKTKGTIGPEDIKRKGKTQFVLSAGGTAYDPKLGIDEFTYLTYILILY